MARDNFSCGSAGKGVQGVDYGNTNQWGDQEWSNYEKQNGIAAPQSELSRQPTHTRRLGSQRGRSP